jgi:hypothetical protein
MHTMIRIKFDAYSEYGSVDHGCWYILRTVSFAAIPWC